MTTTITLETHSWPVETVTRDDHESPCGNYKHKGVTVEIVPPNSKRVFHVTQTRKIEFIEQPLPVAEGSSS